MHEAFLSVVVAIDGFDDATTVTAFLEACAAELAANFTDYEIVVVDNRSEGLLDGASVERGAARQCYVMRLAARVPWDVAVFAGLERANGDYVVVFDSSLAAEVGLITRMYETAQNGFDHVVLRQQRGRRARPQRALFFWIMRKSSPFPLDSRDRKEMLISRRALNWALRHRSRARYLHELYANGGFSAVRVDVDLDAAPERRSDRERSNIAWRSLTRMTEYPLRLAELGMALLAVLLMIGMLNAFTVRLLGRNLLGGPEETVPGWTYIVLLFSVAFLLTNVSIYAVLRVLRVIADDIRDEPLYTIEQVRRIG